LHSGNFYTSQENKEKNMKSSILLFVVAMLSGIPFQNPTPQDFVTILQNAFENQQSGIQIQGNGVVTRLLSDDLEVPLHQRFILRISPQQTVLVAHNIDVAKRVPDLQIEGFVEFYGVYEWNVEGGVIHWTHHDPDGDHIAGWLKYAGNTYQ
jgi:hypothetical protein